jgi:phosphoribosylamine---glycine ligase
VLVVGSGGREDALAGALAASPTTEAVWVAPGNAGTQAASEQAPTPLRADDPQAVVDLARRLGADLVVVGPEAPLCDGVVDALEAAGIRAFGPTAAAAELEGSKAFLKRLATECGIPTARYEIAEDYESAVAAIRRFGAPVVVKADGLCAGKGVVVASTEAEAEAAAHEMLALGRFGAAGKTIIVEECLRGREASVHAISDGERWMLLPVARDHKRIGDGDTGPNTGGMGVIAPACLYPRLPGETDEALAARSNALVARIEREIIEPTIRGMHRLGRPFRGVLFAGLMITPEGDPYLLEHNVRFGDPECEALMRLIEGDVAELLDSAAAGALDPQAVRILEDRHVVVIVLAAAGYPGTPRRGDVIRGLDEAASIHGVRIHHAGTAPGSGEGASIVTAGGRVLAISAIASSRDEARRRAYEAADVVDFEGKQLRRDIGAAE